MSRADTVVVGGGVIGVCVAYYLAKGGRHVTLLEQAELCSGCSRGNAGQITPGHLPLPQPGTMRRNLHWLFNTTSPLYVAPRLDVELLRWLWRFQKACRSGHLRHATHILCQLGRASVTLYDELASETLVRYENPGRLEVCRSQRAFQTACAEAELIGSFGFSSRRLSGAEVKQFEPAVQGKVAGAIYYPDSGFCDPLRFVLRLANAAQGLGAEVRTNTPVTDLRIENGRVVSVVAVGEEIDADAVVLACGSWTPQLTQRLGLRLPVQPGKGYHVDLGLPVLGPRMPIVLLEERIFATPLEGVLRLAGTMEFSGFHLHLRPARLKMLTQGAARYFPHMEHACIRSRWCHLRPMTPDGLPIIGPAPLARNVWIATGHGMLGLTQGPATGKLVAEWIIEGHPGLDLTPLRPERFQRSNRSAFTSAAAARASWLPAHRSGAAYLFRPRRPPGNE